MKKALFSVYGYGLGHATRCDAIIKELKTDNKIIASDDAYNYFEKKGAKPTRINSFKIGTIMSGFSWIQTLLQNVDLPLNMINDYNIIKKTSNEFKPDVIISDTEPVSLLFTEYAGIKSAFLSNIIPIIKDYQLIPSELRDAKLDGQASVIRILIERVLRKNDLIISPTIKRYDMGNKVKFTDLIIRQKPSEAKSEEETRKEHELPKEYILVSFGGAEISNEYYNTLIPILKKIENEYFVISTNNAVKRPTSGPNMKLYPFINDYLAILKASKAVITLAGHSTISEALVYKKPMMIIPIKDHVEQLVNAAIINKEGYGKTYFYKDDINNEKLEKTIKEFIKKIPEYEENIKNRDFKGNGAKESATLIEKL